MGLIDLDKLVARIAFVGMKPLCLPSLSRFNTPHTVFGQNLILGQLKKLKRILLFVVQLWRFL